MLLSGYNLLVVKVYRVRGQKLEVLLICIVLLSKRPENAITQTLSRQDETLPLDASMRQKLLQTYHHYMTWLANKTEPAHYQALEEYANASQAGTLRVLPGAYWRA